MKKSVLITIAVIAGTLVLVGGYCWTTYNSLVDNNLNVDKELANIETQYQRRADLIPNLVETVKGYAKHEQETLNQVVAARAKALSVNAGSEGYAAAQQEVTSSLGRLIAIAENYPNLKANENFKELQAQLEGTENRIAVARSSYNETVKNYNVQIKKFPSNILAQWFNFTERELFAATEGSEVAPQVKF